MELPGSPMKLHVLLATINKQCQQDLILLVDAKFELWLKLWRNSLVSRQVLMEICLYVVHDFPFEARVKDGFRDRHTDLKKNSFKMETLSRLLCENRGKTLSTPQQFSLLRPWKRIPVPTGPMHSPPRVTIWWLRRSQPCPRLFTALTASCPGLRLWETAAVERA